MQLTFKDGSVREFEPGVRALDVAKSLSSKLAKAAVAVQHNGRTYTLNHPIRQDGTVNFLTFDDDEGKLVVRHTAAHIMAQAIKRLYGDSAKLAIGPAIENGFYYDIDVPTPFTQEDLEKIEDEMRKIIAEALPVVRSALPRAEALELVQKQNEPYKVELITDLPEDATITFFTQGEFVDLCAGPHVLSTADVKNVKLLSLAGAYWRGREKNKMLQRIYGTCFEKKADLDAYFKALEEARQRDHRKLGRELDLFTIDEYVGPGLVLWHPKLSAVREQIEAYWRKEHRRNGYEYVYTPHVGQANLWQTSGHLAHYSDIMYPPMSMAAKDASEQTTYYTKPMNCPFHIRIYKSRPRSYRDLPMRWCELGTVYRFEKSGTLHGMMRVRGFTQDDSHVFCRVDQFKDEVNRIINFALSMNKTFGFEKMNVYLSVRDPEDKEKYIDNEEVWALAEGTLEQLLQERNIEYKKDIGGAKFYGPAIDMKVLDSMGREWQGTTIQLDMNLPTLFDMNYIGSDGQEHTPIMLHRTLLGSMERFVGTLIEHYAGAFPTWLAPEQVRILTITDRCDERAKQLEEIMINADMRVHADLRNEKIGFKIREAQLEKVPYMLVIGDKELEANTVAVRSRKNGTMGTMPFEEFLAMVQEEIATRQL